MNAYDSYRVGIIADAQTQGHDPAKVSKVWDACVEEIQQWGDLPQQEPRQRAKMLRQRERQLRKKAYGILGVSLLGLLLSSLLGKGISLLVDWVLNQLRMSSQELDPSTPVGAAFFGTRP